MRELRVGKNLAAKTLDLGEPSDFNIEPGAHPLQTLSKVKRREEMLKSTTEWNVYSCFEGSAPNLRIDKDNPAKWMLALPIDYDSEYTMDEAVVAVDKFSESSKQPGKQRAIPMPTQIERTLSGQIRLLWRFARAVPMPSQAFAEIFIELLAERLQVRNILLGYDANSLKPSQVWTNGAEWADLDQPVVPWEWLLGLFLEVSKRDAGEHTIPLDQIAAEVELRYPGRWKGEFKLDNTGTRFWDEKADNPSGCQVKLDGMLCFTGPFPFRSWADIFGAEWTRTHTETNNGKILELFRYNVLDEDYYVMENGIWEKKDDIQRSLRVLGVSGKIPKGDTASPVDRIVETVQKTLKVSGVGPVVSRPAGVIEFNGYPFINTYTGKVLPSVEGPTKTETDFPLLWKVLAGFDTAPGCLAKESFMFMLRRRYISQRDYRGDSTQAVFIGGEPNTGKTLVGVRVVAAALGGQYSNPYRYFTGQCNFNIQLFSKPLLMVNDEESPNDGSEKRKMHSRIKSCVVNPTQEAEAKFRTPTVIEWKGWILWTLNLDAGDVFQIPEITPSTEDKLCFFRMVDTGIEWNDNQKATEAAIAKELPYFLWWLEHVWVPPAEILATGKSKYQRMGMISYFDPVMRRYALQNTDAYSVWELLEQWIKVDGYWFEADNRPTDNEYWVGTSAELLTMLHAHDQLKPLLQGVTARSLPKSLSTLSKQSFSGVSLDPNSRRHFKIHRHLFNEE